MPVRPIVIYPDPRLRDVAAPVETFGADLAALATDLADTMRAAPGIGITAPHIGVALRVVVLALPEDEAPVTYVNPEIVEASAELFRHVEGSVSMPGVAEDVERPAKVRVRYQDLAGDVHEEEAEGLRAVCHQHEIDQLDGKFWLQSLSRLKRDRVIKRYEKLRRVG
ncbi:peptide deformylase [Acuticoccus yangtzensis]|uniref:peptide deformylase n=1 Tax=Acuticoccus yangtzensis TaxID=1443441 RepID=UPI0009497D90|nr:peptide deformylase [Acuticoccus yangtzensis]